MVTQVSDVGYIYELHLNSTWPAFRLTQLAYSLALCTLLTLSTGALDYLLLAPAPLLSMEHTYH